MNRNGPKCYTNVVQQEYSNNKYYVLAFKYYINIDIANPNDVKYDFINFNLKKKSTKQLISFVNKIMLVIYKFEKESNYFYIIKDCYITYLNITKKKISLLTSSCIILLFSNFVHEFFIHL